MTISVKCKASAYGQIETFFGRYTKLPKTGQDAKPIYQHEDGTDEDGENKYLFYKDGVWNCGPDYESGEKAYLRSEPTKDNIPPTGWLYRQQLPDKWEEFPMLMCLPEDDTKIIQTATTEMTTVNEKTTLTPENNIETLLPWTTVYFSPQGHNDGTKLVKDNLLTTLPSLGKEWRVTHEFRPTDYSTKGWTNSLHLTTGGNTGHGKRIPAIFFKAAKGMCVTFQKDDSSNTKQYIKGDDLPAINKWTRIKISQELLDQKYMLTITIGCKKVFTVQNYKPNEYSEVKVLASDSFYAAHPGSIRNLIIETRTDSFTGYIHE